MMKNARQRYLAVDSSKFGRNAMMKLCHISEVNDVFTDDDPPAELAPILADKMCACMWRAQASRFCRKSKSTKQTPQNTTPPEQHSCGALYCGWFYAAGDTLSATTTPPPCALACCTALPPRPAGCAIRRRRG